MADFAKFMFLIDLLGLIWVQIDLAVEFEE
jgi:hypothetical protein